MMARILLHPQPSRLKLLAALPLFVLATLPGCRQARQEVEQPKEPSAVPSGTAPVATLPAVSLAPLGRAEILSAAAAATDSVAAGRPLPGSLLELTNRSFELRLPFGCVPSTEADRWTWSFDPKTRVLKISVKPQRWTNDPKIAALADGIPFEAAEGFWIERAWTSSEECPPPVTALPQAPSKPEAAPSDTGTDIPPPAPAANIALAQFFGPGAPRTAQRGTRPYTYTGKLGGDASPGEQGFRLRLQGRISGFPDGQPFHCLVIEPSAPPLCVMAVQITGVAFEVPGSRETLAEWTY